MRKTCCFFLVIVLFLCVFSIVNAGPEEVKLIPQSRYSYTNVGGYGFYEKCATKSWFAVILQNTGSKAYTVSLPSEVRIGGWSGTQHPIKNTIYKDMIPGSLDINYAGWKEVSFKGDLSLPAGSQYGLFMDITNIGDYDLYWDTDVFFNITVKDGSKTNTIKIEGVIAQRGNACPADQICSAKVLDSSYAVDGSGQVIVRINNNMPDAANITAKTNVDLSWKDSDGKTQTLAVENGVQWKTQPGWMGSGSQKEISGILTLPVTAASAQSQLTATFHFHFPSSLNFGDFSASAAMVRAAGLSGTLSGNYSVSGAGTFSGTLNNHLGNKATVTLPKQGKVTANDGTGSLIDITWDQTSPLSIDSGGSAKISGKFTIGDTSVIHSNSSLVISAEPSYTSGSSSDKGSAAGTVTRNADPNPVLISEKFCKIYASGSKTVQFTYTLRNDASIDLPVQLATTMAVEGQSGNLPIKYTKCMSGGNSCMSRVKDFDFTIVPGESAEFTGQITLSSVPSNTAFPIQTSLIYSADGKTKALWIGKVASGCMSPSVTATATATTPAATTPATATATTPAATTPATATATTPAATTPATATAVTPKPTTSTPAAEPLSAEGFCRDYTAGSRTMTITYSLKNNTADGILVRLATTLLVQGQSNTLPITYTACRSGSTDCSSRISGKDITLKAGETASFTGKVTLEKAMSSADIYAQTSLVYKYGGKTQSLYIGRTTDICSGNPATATAVTPTTVTPKPTTVTPKPTTATPAAGPLSAEGFCRDYTAGSKAMTITYSLKNNTADGILVRLATTLLVQGQSNTLPITYTACRSGSTDCRSRISGKDITLKAGETASFTGKVTLEKAMSSADIYAQTSLVYKYGGKTQSLYIGRTTDVCSGNPAVPVTTTPTTATPAPTTVTPKPTTVTPKPTASTPVPSEPLSAEGFCRDYTAGSRTMTITYSLKNNTADGILVRLATTLLVQGQSNTLPITYTACRSGGTDCSSRISGKDITLKAGETASFTGKATLEKAMSSADIYAQTSLVYKYGGKTQSLYIGRTTDTCSGTSAETSVPTNTAGSLKVTAFCRNYTAGSTAMTLTYTLKNAGSAAVKVQLARTLQVQGQSGTLPITYTACRSGSTDCSSRISEGYFTLKAGETAAFRGKVTLKTAMASSSIYAETSLVYQENGADKALYIGRTTSSCSTAKDASSAEAGGCADELIMKDISETEMAADAPALHMTVSGAGYSACGSDKALRFIMYIRNDGMTAGTLDLKDLVFSTSGTRIPVRIASCAEMSGFGTDSESCLSELKEGIFSVIPGVTLRLEGIWEPQKALRDESILISAVSPAFAEDEYTFEAVSSGGTCGPDVEILSDPEGNKVRTDTDSMDGRMTLIVKMVNSGLADEKITPGTVYLHNGSLEAYRGTGMITSGFANGADKETFEFVSGKSFSLPAGSDAELRLTVDTGSVQKAVVDPEITWTLSVGSETFNLLGSIGAVSSNGVRVVTDTAGAAESGTQNRMQLIAFDKPALPDRLPSTGFPTHGPAQASVQPGNIVYQQLHGLHLEIPSLSASMDIVGVPLDENGEWAVTWLGDKAGILDGTPLPGKGTAVIAAHNHLNEAEAGPFVGLSRLEPLDRMFITDANGRFLSYRVYANELVSPDAGESIYEKAVPGSLVLLTCEQELPEGGYAYRRAVYAEPLRQGK